MRQGQVTLRCQSQAIAGARRQRFRQTLDASDTLKLPSVFTLQVWYSKL